MKLPPSPPNRHHQKKSFLQTKPKLCSNSEPQPFVVLKILNDMSSHTIITHASILKTWRTRTKKAWNRQVYPTPQPTTTKKESFHQTKTKLCSNSEPQPFVVLKILNMSSHTIITHASILKTWRTRTKKAWNRQVLSTGIYHL